MLKFGEHTISKLYLGNQQINKVYYGAELVYSEILSNLARNISIADDDLVENQFNELESK